MRGSVPARILSILALLGAHTVEASPVRLTLEQAVALALAANPDPTNVELAKAQLERSRAYLPGNPFFSVGGGTNSGQGVPPNYQFLLSQEFELPGKRQSRVAAAEQGVEQAAWEQKSAQLDLSAAVRTAFVHALGTAARLTLAQQTLDAAEELVHNVPNVPRMTPVRRIELNIAQVQTTRARREVASAQQEDEDARGRLRQLTGLHPEETLDLIGSLRSAPLDIPPALALIDRAKEQSPTLVALQHATKRAETEVMVQQRDGIPNVTLFGSVSRFQDDTIVGGDVGVPIPVFQTRTADVQEALAQRDRTARQLRELKRTIDVEVREARRACIVAADNLIAFEKEILPKLEENVDVERQLYEAQSVGVSDLIGQQIDLINGRREHIDALESYNASLIELERVVGGSLSNGD